MPLPKAVPAALASVPGARHVSLAPGQYHASAAPVVIHTLLGSCVAACLYDPATQIVGMNHFLLPTDERMPAARECMTEAGRYGIHAMELVINGMLRLGARRQDIRAKAFGGAEVLPRTGRSGVVPHVSERNRRFLREFLRTEGIPLVAAGLGGTRGRVIYFDSRDFGVHVRRIGPRTRLAERDRQFWREQVSRVGRTAHKPDIW